MISREQKEAFLKMSLDEKIKRTKELILEWYLQYEGKVYIAFSGGKDSTVLLHIARSIKTCADIPAVFSDTGLEYPEIREFVKKKDNVVWIKPKLTFKKVIEKYGFPVISKEQSHFLYDMRNSKSEKLKNTRLNGGKNGKSGKLSLTWRPLINANFKISDLCCSVMKKRPFKAFEHAEKRFPILGIMAEESRLRLQSYFAGNCNAFSASRPVSRPLMFWNEQDILEYIVREKLEIASVYGNIVRGDDGKLHTTGCHRTGCMFCMYGLHLEGHPNRFERMKETHPKQYDYIMNKLGGGKVVREYLACARNGQIDLEDFLLTDSAKKE